MGLSSYPTPSDGGVLCVVLVSTVMSINMVKGLVHSFLRVVGIRTSALREEYTISSREEEYNVDNHSHSSSSDGQECRRAPSKWYIEEFRTRNPSVEFGSICCGGDSEHDHQHEQQECSVCLIEFEPKSVINKLECGHVFHMACMEKWLDCWNVTCPLCRSRVLYTEEEEDAFSW